MKNKNKNKKLCRKKKEKKQKKRKKIWRPDIEIELLREMKRSLVLLEKIEKEVKEIEIKLYKRGKQFEIVSSEFERGRNIVIHNC